MNLLVILTLVATCSAAVFARDWPWTKTSRQHKDTHRVRSSKTCLSGDGSSYRGSVSVSARGRKCLYWQDFERVKGPYAVSKGLGTHNYCRNPDQSLMPWCRVRRGLRIVRELCDIPQCAISTPKPPVTPEVDTELTCGEKPLVRQRKIVGGALTSIESQPWVAAIFHKRLGFNCGGSLIAPCWVLTAAHCFPDGKDTVTRHLSVYLGKTYLNETDADREQKFSVEKLIIHQNYVESDDNYNNDIALLKIKNGNGECAMRTAFARTVCLPPRLTMLPAGVECKIAGFGKESERALGFSQHLKHAEVTLLPESECKRDPEYVSRFTHNMFCAASPTWSTDACKGDSGGPLVCEVSGRMFVFGVVSWGEGCSRVNKPGVYTRITNYNSWIAQKTRLPSYAAGLMYPKK